MSAGDSYELIWDTPAFEELLAILGASSQRADAVRAMELAESTLPHRPHDAGEYLSEGLWRFDAETLIFFYEIDDESRAVRITGVWQRPPRP
jgi:hypothetical protein